MPTIGSLPNVCVVSVTWNKKYDILELLKSLENEKYQNKDVIVVDNNSSDGTVDAIHDQFPKTKVLVNAENLGGAGGFNTGITEAISCNKYKYIWLLDNDVYVDSEALCFLVDSMERYSQASVCGSKIYRKGTKKIQESGAYINWLLMSTVLNRADESEDRGEDDSLINVDYCAACSLLVRIDDIKIFGSMDAGMFVFWDDIEWCTRFKRGGRTILCDQRSKIWHYFGGDKPDLPWRVYYRTRNHVNFFLRYAHPLTRQIDNIFLKVHGEQGINNLKKLGFIELASAMEQGFLDGLQGKKGKWNPTLTPTIKNYESQETKLDGIEIIIFHESYIHNFFGKTHINQKVWMREQPFLQKFQLLLNLIVNQSMFVSLRPHIAMFFASIICIDNEGKKVYFQQNKIKRISWFLTREILFLTKRWSLLSARSLIHLVSYLIGLNKRK